MHFQTGVLNTSGGVWHIRTGIYFVSCIHVEVFTAGLPTQKVFPVLFSEYSLTKPIF